METTAFASLIAFALILIVACFAIGNPWIGLALLVVLGMFAYNHLNVTRGFRRIKLWGHRRHLSMIDRTIFETREQIEEALFDHDFMLHAAHQDFLEHLYEQRRVCIAKIQRLDFELRQS
jgi:hypothetical protein